MVLLQAKYSIEVIRPAEKKFIDKYTASPSFLFRETPALYASVTLPWIQGPGNPPSSLTWVKALLEKTKEQDRLMGEGADWIVYAYAPQVCFCKKDPNCVNSS